MGDVNMIQLAADCFFGGSMATVSGLQEITSSHVRRAHRASELTIPNLEPSQKCPTAALFPGTRHAGFLSTLRTHRYVPWRLSRADGFLPQ